MKVPESLKGINFEITRKKIKNIILKIESSEKIKISLPLRATIASLEGVIERKEEWILEVVEKLRNKKVKEISYNTGDKIKLVDKIYLLDVKESILERIYEERDTLYLETTHINNEEYKKQMVNYWYREKGYQIFSSIIEKYLNLTGKKITKLTVKTLKRNWGSCQTKTKEINLNSELLKKDMEFIEYVILHEIAHLEHPNHSKKFYNYIEKFMPNYKKIKTRGREFE